MRIAHPGPSRGPSATAKALLYFVLFTIIYMLLAVCLPPNDYTIQTYRLNAGEYHILQLLVGIPYAFVWFAGFYGYAQLLGYAKHISNSVEGRAFQAIGDGFKWLAWGLPASVNLNLLLGGIAHSNQRLGSAALIISHYFALFFSVVAFSYIANGARELTVSHAKLPSRQAIRATLLIILTAVVAYTYLTIRAVQDQHPNQYRLPVWLILLTILVPSLYAWLMGLVAAQVVARYSRGVTGLIYRRALSYVAAGTVLSIIMAVCLQYDTLSSKTLRRIAFDEKLLIVYIILLLYAVGLLLIGYGASKLRRIEEV